MKHLKYMSGYSPELLHKVENLISTKKLGETLLRRYPQSHKIRTDNALYDYAQALKCDFLSNAPQLARVGYCNKIQVMQHALGQHHFITRVQGSKLKIKNEIKIANVFRSAPEAFLKMIVVHELAHFREKEHNKAFYNLCCHMEPNYHQYEFDLRLYLTHLQLFGELYP
jgi:predicted metal-dependent hydrolase